MTASRPEPRLPVDARGDLHLEAPTGTRLNLRAQGDTLLLDVPAWDDIASLAPSSFLSARRFLRSAAALLLTAGLRFELSVAGRPALAVGTNVKPTLLSRLLGLRAVRLSLWQLPALRVLR